MRTTKTASEADIGRGQRTARSVFSALGIVHPTDYEIETLAYARNAIVRVRPLSGCQGRLARLGRKKAIITVSDSIAYRPRQRWVIAHELGHLELHPDTDQLDICSEQDISERYDQGTEKEANAFAAEFLMPAELWKEHVDVEMPTLGVVAELADEYEVSFIAAAIRFAKLSPDRIAVIFCKANKVEWWVTSADFHCWIDTKGDLDPYTLAQDYFKKGSVRDRPETVSASAWVSGSRIDDDDHLIEHCRPIPSLGATLSLLWIPPSADF